MSLKAQRRAASVLLRATPPYRSAAAVRNVVRLRDGDPANEPAFVAHVLASATRTHTYAVCARRGCERHFIASEFNRDGDAHRCPWCDQYTTTAGTCYPRAANATNAVLRKLEKRFIYLFTEYTRLYYGDGATVNCFTWSNDGSLGDLGVAVLIVNHVDAETLAQATGSSTPPSSPGVWNSSHVFSMVHAEREDSFVYRGTSTVFVDIATGACRYNGFIERAHKLSTERFTPDLYAHVAAVGSRIQDMENELRADVAGAAFSRTEQIVSCIRTSSGRASARPMEEPRGERARDNPLLLHHPSRGGGNPQQQPIGAASSTAQPVAAPRSMPLPPPPAMPQPTVRPPQSTTTNGHVAPPAPMPPPPPPSSHAASSSTSGGVNGRAHAATDEAGQPHSRALSSTKPPPATKEPEPAWEDDHVVAPPAPLAAQEEEEEGWDAEPAAEEGAEEEAQEEGDWTLEQVVESLELDDVAGTLQLLEAAAVFNVADLLQCDEAYLKAAGLPKPARKALAEWVSWQFAEEGGEEAA